MQDDRHRTVHGLLLALLMVAACSDGWRESYRTSNAALQSGVEIVHLIETDTDVAPPATRVELNVRGRRLRVSSLADLRRHIKTVDSPDAALRYSELLREFRLADVVLAGDVILYAPEGRRRPMQFGPAEAKRWRIEFPPLATPDGSDWVLQRPVLVTGNHPSPELPYDAPVVLLVEERVSARGGYTFEVLRVLETGETASSYVSLRH